MARPLRMESAGGIYHVLNRGNYRTHIFRGERTREAFLKCLGEACRRTGWRVHAWCIMLNHFHLALSTPRANLVEGMRWMQGTFASRFNGLRRERGHVFQGRYKSLVVDPDEGSGPLCHYIHLNPVLAKICPVEDLPQHRWASLRWLLQPSIRPAWYDPLPALEHAGSLADTPRGRQKYLEYLAWLAEDAPARRAQRFETMTKGWVLGTGKFIQTMVRENRQLVGHGRRIEADLREARETVWERELVTLLRRVGRTEKDIGTGGKSADWKLALAAAMKDRTTVTNRWLAAKLSMGNLYEVSRKVAAWIRRPDPALHKRLQATPNPKA